jgi:hypothetical protein
MRTSRPLRFFRAGPDDQGTFLALPTPNPAASQKGLSTILLAGKLAGEYTASLDSDCQICEFMPANLPAGS